MSFGDFLDWILEEQNQGNAKNLMLICLPKTDFTFYMELQLVSDSKNAKKIAWIGFRNDYEFVRVHNFKEFEWEHPIKFKQYKGARYMSKFNLKNICKETVNKDGWRFSKPVGFRFRGEAYVHSVTIY